MAKKKILQINSSSDIGGGPAIMFNIISNLTSEFDFVVAAPSGTFMNKYHNIGVKTYTTSIRSLNPLVILRLLSIIKHEGITLIHTHGKGAGLWGRIAAFFARVKVAHTFHGIHYKNMNWIAAKIYFLIEQTLSLWTAVIINTSESERSEGLKYNIYKPNQARTIPNGIPITTQTPVEKDYNLILNIGNIGAPKNQLAILGIVPHLPPQMRVEIIGRIIKPELAIEITKKIKEAKLEDRVKFIGEKSNEEVMKCLQRSYIYLTTSLWEGLPLTMLEAGAAGLPIVASRVVGHIDVIQDGINGMLFDLAQPKDAAEKIKQLIDNQGIYQKISQNIKDTVISKYSLKNMVDQHREVYSKYA